MKIKAKELKETALYRVSGPALRRAIGRTGLTQREFSRLVGWSDSRISHIMGSDTVNLRGSTVKRIERVLSKYGVAFDGMSNG